MKIKLFNVIYSDCLKWLSWIENISKLLFPLSQFEIILKLQVKVNFNILIFKIDGKISSEINERTNYDYPS